MRELQSQHHQAVELHEAFKAHVEAKEAARSLEQSGWDIKRQSSDAEHKLTFVQMESEYKQRVNQQQAKIDQLTLELEEVHAQFARRDEVLDSDQSLLESEEVPDFLLSNEELEARDRAQEEREQKVVQGEERISQHKPSSDRKEKAPKEDIVEDTTSLVEDDPDVNEREIQN